MAADVLDAVAVRVRAHAASSRKRANALLHFYKLPTELLIHVARYALANLHFRIKALVDLTSVSSRLRDVLVSERSLWTSVEWEASPHIVSLAFRRSYPLCVDLPVDGLQETPDGERSESPLLQEVLAQPNRLRTVTLTILEVSYPRIPPLTADIFPHLTSLTLDIVPARPGGTLVRPLQSISLLGPPPLGLRRLRIQGLTVELIPSVWQGLERLWLVDAGITSSSILEVLRHCHLLRYLEVAGDVLLSPMPEDHQAVTSGSITSIAFAGPSIQFLPLLLPFVTLPNCRALLLILGEEHSGTLSPNAVAAFAYASRVMLLTHPIGCTFSAIIHNNEFMLSLGRKDINNEPAYRLEVFIPSTYRFLPHWIAHLMHLHPWLQSCYHRVAINTPIPDPQDEDDEEEEEEEDFKWDVHDCHDREGSDIDEDGRHPIRTLSDLFYMGVDELSIYGASPFGIYRAMSRPLPSGRWLLAAVKTLSILGPADVDIDLNPLLNMLRARAGIPGGAPNFEFIHLPPQLDGETCVEEIREITGHRTTIAFNPL